MIRRPPRSTLFPTRRSSDLADPRYLACSIETKSEIVAPIFVHGEVVGERSEEHTSELQSRQYLVCRLLLEKKNENERNESVRELISDNPQHSVDGETQTVHT